MPASARNRAEARFITARNNQRVLTDHDKGTIVLLESKVLNLATDIEQFVPDGRLKSLALTHLEETLTWANKAIYTEGAAPGEPVENAAIQLAYVGKERGNIVRVTHYTDDEITFVSDVPEPEPQTLPDKDFFAKFDRAPEFDR